MNYIPLEPIRGCRRCRQESCDRSPGDSACASESAAGKSQSKARCNPARPPGPHTAGRENETGGMVHCSHRISAPRRLPAAAQGGRRATAVRKVRLLYQAGTIRRLPRGRVHPLREAQPPPTVALPPVLSGDSRPQTSMATTCPAWRPRPPHNLRGQGPPSCPPHALRRDAADAKGGTSASLDT